MAVAGALIVFSGLVVLSYVISQLHKVLLFWEKKHSVFINNHIINNHKMPENDEPEEAPKLPVPRDFPTDLDEAACLYQPLIEEVGETFYLSDLYDIARKNDFPHPHITLTAFRDSEILVPYGDGVFGWNPHTENNDIEKD
jgi:hypothetical protein